MPIGKCNKKWWDSFLHISLGLNSLPMSCDMYIDSTLKAFPESLIYVVNQRLSNIFRFCMPKMIQDNTKVMFIISVLISYLLTYIFLKAIEVTGL